MIKISALNTDSSSPSDSDDDSPKITKEAQEEITLTKYNKALNYQRQGKLNEALYILREVVEEDLPKLVEKDVLPKKLLSLKYACHQNIGMIFYKKDLKAIALEYYLDAAEIDNTDVTLWNRIGDMAIEQKDFNLAVQAFLKGLECNPKHWPCLDKAIMLLYALRDEVSCLYYISKAFQLDPDYLRGLALRHTIYRYNSAIKEYYEAAYKNHLLDPPLNEPFDEVEGAKLIAESEEIAEQIIAQIKANEPPAVPPKIDLIRPLEEYTWLDVGKILIEMHKYIIENNLSLFSPIDLNKKALSKADEHEPMDIDQTDHLADDNSMKTSETDNIIYSKCDSEIQSICHDIIDDIIDKVILKEKQNGGEAVYQQNRENISEMNGECRNSSEKIEENNEAVSLVVDENKTDQVINEEIVEYEGTAAKLTENVVEYLEDEEMNENNLVFENNEPNYEIDELVKITSELEKSEEKGEIIVQHLEEVVTQMETDVAPPHINNKLSDKMEQDQEASLIIAAETSASAVRNDSQLSLTNVPVEQTNGGDVSPKTVTDEIPAETTVEEIDKEMKKKSAENNENKIDDKTSGVVSDAATNQETDKEEGPSATDTEGPSTTDESKVIKTKVNLTKQTNRRRRSSLSMLEIWGWHSKRRSNRAAKPKKGQREVRDDTIRGALKRILPASLYLYPLQTNNEDGETQNLNKSQNTTNTKEEYFGSSQELVEVKKFWEEFTIGSDSEKSNIQCDIITLLEYYIPVVASKWMYTWPQDLISVYIECHELYRLYFHHPCILDENISLSKLKSDAELSLLYGELLLDQWLYESQGNINQPMQKCLPVQTEAQLWFVAFKEQNWKDDYVIFFTRVFFLKSLLFINRKQNSEAIDTLQKLLYALEDRGYDESLQITLRNCKYNNTININEISEMLQSLERYENLSKMVPLFDKKKFDVIIPILKSTFEHKIVFNRLDSAPGGADRPLQIVMLLECLWFKNQFSDCIIWSIKGLSESFDEYLKIDKDNDLYDRWQTVIVKCLAIIEATIKETSVFILDVLSHEQLQELVKILSNIVCHQIEVDDHTTSIPLETVTPWILLHRILQREEDRGRIKIPICERKSGDGSDDDDDSDDIPASIMILFAAHDYLGNRSWCAFNEGELLLFTLDIVMPSLRSPLFLPIREKMNQYIEQIYYCLYQHPSKKNNKLRYLIDHNVPPQKLSWERAQQLYDFYRPDYIPEFDAYKLESISAETEGLLKRVVHLIPPEKDPQSISGEIMAYIDGEVDKMPNLKPTLPSKISGIYYLLADYYFKNNEFTKAFKYYTLDLCNNPKRIDSWAGMALARASVLETKLNSCEPVSDNEFLEKARTVQVCFKQSLEICPNRSMLWIEYGAFVYSIHSFCSRLMKSEADTLSMEKFEILETQKEALLKSALECFTSADKVWQHLLEINETPDQDERWLHQYMQGKIAEKQAKDPSVFLQHYMKAKDFLHESNAQYPVKINYNNPQILAVEALEVYYRIHASVLKYLELHEKKDIYKKEGSIFNKCLNECANSYFVQCLSKDEIEKRKLEKEQMALDEANRKRTNTEEIPETNVKKPKIDDPSIVGSEVEETPAVGEITEKETTDPEKIEDPQAIMDRLMKQCMAEVDNVEMDSSNESTDVTKEKKAKDEEIVTTENEEDKEVKENPETKPTSPIRRDSQESTTTTATSTQEGSSSDSSESSSSDDSTDGSSSSSSSESSDDDSETSRQSKTSKLSGDSKSIDSPMTVEQLDKIIQQCLRSLELCVIRFPQHYKAIYRLAYHYFHRSKDRDLVKCRDLLLSQYKCSDGTIIQGLFADRKNNNFFNGVWRIPVSEMDRPGSFAAHMSRCVTLLMQVLRASADHRTLLELCLQLKRTPDPDKKYLREPEREQLSQQALSLCVQCLRELLKAVLAGKHILTHSNGTNTIVSEAPTQQPINVDPNPFGQLLLDIYRAYQKVQKNLPNKEPVFSSLLTDAYKQYLSGKLPDGLNTLDLAVKFCQQRLAANRQQANNQNSGASNVIFVGNPNINGQNMQSNIQKKSSKSSYSGAAGRPRGRPPNINKHDLLGSKYKFPNSAIPLANLNLPPTGLNYYPFHPLLMTAATMGKVDPSAAALTLMMSNYQELMRQYQSSLSSIPNLPPEVTQSLLNYGNITLPPGITATFPASQTSKYTGKSSSYSNKDTGIRQSSSLNKDIAKISVKEPTKTKNAPNKDSILKAVYGKEKSNKHKEAIKQELYKKEINLFKDRPFLSVTQISPPITKPTSTISSTCGGKTLQQKLAERQKQNSPNKNTNFSAVDLTSPPSTTINYPLATNILPFTTSPPAAHTSSSRPAYNIPYGPLPAHTNSSPIKSTSLAQSTLPPKKSKLPDTVPFAPIPQQQISPLQISPPIRHSENISITQLQKPTQIAPVVNKSQTSKLLNYRKPNLTKPASSSGLNNPSNVTGKNKLDHLPPPPPMTKKPPPIPSPKLAVNKSEPEIIVLDDD